jgi:uncharacterized membrane protein
VLEGREVVEREAQEAGLVSVAAHVQLSGIAKRMIEKDASFVLVFIISPFTLFAFFVLVLVNLLFATATCLLSESGEGKRLVLLKRKWVLASKRERAGPYLLGLVLISFRVLLASGFFIHQHASCTFELNTGPRLGSRS